jgi:preprotein translocase subunit YajC
MKIRLFSILAFGLALTITATAQDASAPAQASSGAPAAMGGGRSVMGTVTEVATDHYTLKTEAGEVYTVHFSVNTRILKQNVQHHGEGVQGMGGNGPQSIKPSDIKVGDAVAVMGEVDASAKSVGAVAVVQIDPDRAKQLRELQASFGKTWLIGKVTAVNETTVTLMSNVDHTAHSFVADENTTLRKGREPITLADVQVGNMVRAEGAVKDGVFVATSISVANMTPGGAPASRRDAEPAPQPK